VVDARQEKLGIQIVEAVKSRHAVHRRSSGPSLNIMQMRAAAAVTRRTCHCATGAACLTFTEPEAIEEGRLRAGWSSSSHNPRYWRGLLCAATTSCPPHDSSMCYPPADYVRGVRRAT
jgi:hypothetical protein